MRKYVFRRLLQLIPILLGLSMLVFALLYISPGDPVQRQLMSRGVAVNQEILDQQRQEMGLDRPFLQQYGAWLLKVLHADMGISYKDGFPVVAKLLKAMKYTALLSIASISFAILFSIPLGIYAAVRQDRLVDYMIRMGSFIGNSIPNFMLCILLIFFFCIRHKWFPVVAKNNVQGLFLPMLSLSIPLISQFVRQVRAAVLDQLKKDYVQGSRIRGVKEHYILFFNVLHNALPAIITVLGLSIGGLLGGSVIIENIFRWPGIGKLVMESISDRDYPIVQGFVLLTAIIYVFINLIIDIAYKYLDPRTER